MAPNPLQRDRAARYEFLDAILAAAERLLQRGRGDVALAALAVDAFPPVLRQSRQLPDDLRKFAVAGRVEGELYIALTDLLRLHDVTIVGRIKWMVFLERFK